MKGRMILQVAPIAAYLFAASVVVGLTEMGMKAGLEYFIGPIPVEVFRLEGGVTCYTFDRDNFKYMDCIQEDKEER